MNKKGFVGDMGIYVILIFAIALSLVVIYYINDTINTAVQGNEGFPAISKTIFSRFNNRFVAIWDAWSVFLVLGFLAVLVITAFALRSHPVFAMFSILILIFIGILSVHFSNSYNDVVTNPVLLTHANEFGKLNFIMTNLPKIFIALGFIFIIVLFAKTKSQGINI